MGQRSYGVRRWRQWTEDEAQRVLEELAATSESAAHFARRKGISPQRVTYWRRRLEDSRRPEFVAVALPVATPRCIEIAAAGVIVRVGEDLDVDHGAAR